MLQHKVASQSHPAQVRQRSDVMSTTVAAQIDKLHLATIHTLQVRFTAQWFPSPFGRGFWTTVCSTKPPTQAGWQSPSCSSIISLSAKTWCQAAIVTAASRIESRDVLIPNFLLIPTLQNYANTSTSTPETSQKIAPHSHVTLLNCSPTYHPTKVTSTINNLLLSMLFFKFHHQTFNFWVTKLFATSNINMINFFYLPVVSAVSQPILMLIPIYP